jgi:hypothetical protein
MQFSRAISQQPLDLNTSQTPTLPPGGFAALVARIGPWALLAGTTGSTRSCNPRIFIRTCIDSALSRYGFNFPIEPTFAIRIVCSSTLTPAGVFITQSYSSNQRCSWPATT